MMDTTRNSSGMAANKPPVLSAAEIDELLSMTLIANLATLDNDGGIHLLPIWFLKTLIQGQNFGFQP